MRRRAAAFAGCAALLLAGWPGSATAQINCEYRSVTGTSANKNMRRNRSAR